MDRAGFVRNAWYVAAPSEEIGRGLTPLTILGEKLVFFRRQEGSVAALEDACPHRKLPLSTGSLQGDTVVCGYHGLTFDGAVQLPLCPGTPWTRVPEGPLADADRPRNGVLVACRSTGIKAPRSPSLDLGLDAGAMRFRALVDKRIAAERGRCA